MPERANHDFLILKGSATPVAALFHAQNHIGLGWPISALVISSQRVPEALCLAKLPQRRTATIG